VTPVRPCIVIVGGVNGSGKSTFAKQAANSELLLGQTAINPDDLSREAEAEMPKLNIAGANLAGAERAEKAVWRAIAEGRSVAVETVLSSEKFFPILDAARKRRYRSRLIFVALPSVDEALARIASRVALGGHNVPADRVKARWARAHDNLVRLLPLVDDVLVFSNAATVPILVAERTGRSGKLQLRNGDVLPELTNRLLPSGYSVNDNQTH
jgi:predicted ABC-type ATPase